MNLFVAIPNEIVLTFEIQFSIPAKINDRMVITGFYAYQPATPLLVC